MPIELQYDAEKTILYAKIKESISIDEAEENMKTITQSDEYPPDTPILWDIRSFDTPSFTDKNSFNKIIELRKKYPQRGNAKIAIVVSSEFSFGMSRMYEILSDKLPQYIMVFRDYMEAENWLMDG